MNETKEKVESECKEKFPFSANISIPFECERHAAVISKSLLIEFNNEGSRLSSGISKFVNHSQNELLLTFTTKSLKLLRVNVNYALELVILLINTIDNFDLDCKQNSSQIKKNDG